MTRARKRHPYYNYARLWSYNAVYNFLVGGRGLGKTYGAKKAAIAANIKRGEEFVYVRRFDSELKPARRTFFADVEVEFPDWDFRIEGGIAQKSPVADREEKKRQWTVVGYFIALSKGQTQKSVSFPKVTLIIFDEFIIEKTNVTYLPNEADIFNNLYNTVDRNQDKTRVLFLANSVSIMNPYFLEYEIRPDKLGEFSTSHGGFIFCHFPDSEAFASSVYQTRFGKFIKGTAYADYAVGSKFEDANDSLISEKPPTAKYKYTLETKHGTFSLWHDSDSRRYYAQKKRPRGNEILLTLVPGKMSEEKTLMTFSDKTLSYLRTDFRQGRVVFDRPSTRNAFVEIFKR